MLAWQGFFLSIPVKRKMHATVCIKYLGDIIARHMDTLLCSGALNPWLSWNAFYIQLGLGSGSGLGMDCLLHPTLF